MSNYITQLQDGQGNVHYPQTVSEAVLHNDESLADFLALMRRASFKNILDNWDFRYPVNQRNASGAVSDAYCIDRWRGNGTVTPTAGTGITLASGTALEQRIDQVYTLFAGKTFTFSAMIGGEVKSVTGTWPTNSGVTTDLSVTGIGTIRFGNSSAQALVKNVTEYYPYLRITASQDVTIEAVKLELGDMSTLAIDPPMDYETELQKCLRYYQPVGRSVEASSTTGGRYLAYNVTSAQVVICIDFPTMRKTPQAVSTSFVGETTRVLTGVEIGEYTYNINTLKNGKLTAVYTRSSGAAEMLYVIPKTKIWLTADL